MRVLGASIAARGATMLCITMISPMIATKLIDVIQYYIEEMSSSIQVQSKLLMGEGCLMKSMQSLSSKLPMFNEQLLTTILTLLLVNVAAPFLFSIYDSELLSGGANAAISEAEIREIEQSTGNNIKGKIKAA
jgi:hypothetical protein